MKANASPLLLSVTVLASAVTVWAQGGYIPYDGAGRYTMDRDDGLRSVQGLAALAARHGLKPYDMLGGDGRWQTERVIFTDLVTGATVYRLTNDPFADELSYFKGNFTADGSTVIFRRRPGMWESSTPTHGPMAMRSDGTGLRAVFRDFGLVRRLNASFTDPGLCFGTGDETTLAAFDVRRGKLDHVIAKLAGQPWHLKVSLDGRYVMGRGKLSTGVNGLWIYSVDGSERYEIAVPESIHDSYQFVPGQKKIMYWYEGKFYDEGFVQRDFDGGRLAKIGVRFDWNHGDCGFDRGAHCEGYITRTDGSTWQPMEWLCKADPKAEYYDDPADYNGYLTWRPKDELWAYATRILARPYLSELQLMALEPVPGDVAQRCRVCYTNLHRGAALDNPEASPDGTKVLFNSTMLGSCSIYMVVAKWPEPPTNVTARRGDVGVVLSWQPARHHAETRGYRVYRADNSGAVPAELTPEPVEATTFTDPDAPAGRPWFYLVTAQEWSGLESRPSAEIAVLPLNGPALDTVTYVEAETGTHGPEVWKAYHGSASDLSYLWDRRHGAAGVVTVPVSVPRAGAYHLWLRACSLSGRPVTFAARVAETRCHATCSGNAWTWLALSAAVALPEGGGEVEVTVSAYGGAVDVLALTTGDRVPSDAPRLPGFGGAVLSVDGLKAEAAGPFAVRVSWNPVASPRLHHYNLYQGSEAGFRPSAATLVASPDGPGYVDWSLPPGATVYYRVGAVDMNGKEVLSSAVQVTTAPLAITRADLALKEPEGSARPRVSTCGFEVPAPGKYVVWLKLQRGKGEGSYLDLDLDARQKATWTIQLDGLSETPWFRYNEFAVFELTAGRHTLTVRNSTPHVVTAALITNDLSFAAAGHVNMPTGW